MDIILFDKKLFDKRLKIIKKAAKKAVRSVEKKIYFETDNNITTAFWTNGKIITKFRIGQTADEIKGFVSLDDLITDDNKLTINTIEDRDLSVNINTALQYFDLKISKKEINRSHLGTKQLLLALNILQQESFILKQTETEHMYHGSNPYNYDEFIIMGYKD